MLAKRSYKLETETRAQEHKLKKELKEVAGKYRAKAKQLRRQAAQLENFQIVKSQ